MPELDLPSSIGGRYRPLRLLGKGGMGIVYEVEHLRTGQRLALKVLTVEAASSVERFQREARAACQIPSEHVVLVTDADVAPELGGAPFLVMELLTGADLERASGNKPVPPAEVVLWLRQVARALGKAHERGIVHRDLKPDNLFLTQRDDGSPHVKVLDFGIAKMVAEATVITRSDQFLGTPMYMAPEQAGATGIPVTAQADLYALGLTAYRLLMGRTYWDEGNLSKVLTQVLAAPMPPPSKRGAFLGPDFDAWFLRACDRNPAKRFTSASEQVEALAAALGLPTLPAHPPSTATPAVGVRAPAASTLVSATPQPSSSDVGPRLLRDRRSWITGAVAVVVALIAIALAGTRGAPRSGPAPERSAPGGSSLTNAVPHASGAEFVSMATIPEGGARRDAAR